MQWHLHDTTVGTAELAVLMPDAGIDWSLFGGSGSVLLDFIINYVDQWESLLERWESEDLTLLQPAMACPCYFAGYFLMLNVFAAVTKREVELAGQTMWKGGEGGASSIADRFGDSMSET